MDFYKDRNTKDNHITIVMKAIERLGLLKNYKQGQWGMLLCERHDKAMIWGLYSKYKPNTLFRQTVYDTYSNVLAIELGYIHREKYYSMWWNEQGCRTTHPNIDCDSKRFEQLDIVLQAYQPRDNGYILVCGQVPHDRQLHYLQSNYALWLLKLFHSIKKHTDREIIFRYHPKDKSKYNLPEYVVVDKKDLQHSIDGAHVVVAYNSTVLVESVIRGCPIICFDMMTPVYHLADHTVNNIDNPHVPCDKERLQTLYNMSYNQWTADEISNGLAIGWMLKLIDNKTPP